MSLRDAIRQNLRDMRGLSQPEMTSLTSVLLEVRDKTAKALASFIKENKGTEYQLHKHRSLLYQLDQSLKIVERELPKETLRDLKRGAKGATTKAVRNTEDMIREGEKKFRGTSASLRIPVAKVLTEANRTIIGRLETKSSKYAGDVGDRIRRELAIGVVRGESVDALAQRLVGKRTFERLKDSPTKLADKIADDQLFRSEADAERLVRTELANAYTEAQLESISEINGRDPGWRKMWDAANDIRVCLVCRALHGVVVDLNQNFPGGVKGPPIHPNDRCCVVPVRDDWPSEEMAATSASVGRETLGSPGEKIPRRR